MVKFKLEVELGNEAMQNLSDVASALERVAERLHEMKMFNLSSNGLRGKIMDQNGNSVGNWEVSNA